MSGGRVMVVCEHPSFRQELAHLIEEHGLESYPAADGIDALRQIYHVQPQVIVSDAELSRLSGFEFLAFVRRRFPAVAVIALREQNDEGLTSPPPADLLLPTNPWNPTRFINHVEHLLSQGPIRGENTGADCA